MPPVGFRLTHLYYFHLLIRLLTVDVKNLDLVWEVLDRNGDGELSQESIIHCRGPILIQRFRIKKIQKKIKILNFKKIKKYSKNNLFFPKIRGLRYFRLLFEYFLFVENFEHIEDYNFFSSFKVFLKTTPVAAIGFFNPNIHVSKLKAYFDYI